jgi:long-chain acyl-CoA synthetase
MPKIQGLLEMKIQLKCQTLIELFNQSLGRVELAEKPCLEIVRTEREEKLTFGQLWRKGREFAVHLIQSRDIRAGDKIAVLGKNRADWDVALWGIILAGAVPVLIDPEKRVEGIKKHLLHTDAKLLVMADDYQDGNCREKLKEFLRHNSLGLVEMTVYEKPSLDSISIARLVAEIRTEVKADDTAVILCTSGTTGDPREVEITHSNLIANMQGALDVVTITVADKLGHIMPPHHSFGLTVGKLLPLWVGATNLYTNRYHQISHFIRDKRITIFVGIPALFTVFARKIEQRITEQKEKKRLVRLTDRYLSKLVGKRIVKKLGWGSLRFFVSGAAPVPKWVLEVFWRRGLELWEGYGTTENSPIYGFNANRRKLGSVGKPISTLSVKIVNEQDQKLGPGETGEIVLGGPCVMKGYYKNPKATQAVIKTDNDSVRWLHTGDLGYLDEDGCLFVTGREKNLIVLPSGKNVSPELVELALSKAQYVEELVVVPSYQEGPASVKQEAVKAIVRPAWEQIEAETKLCRRDLVEQPGVLKNLVWQSINKCQQETQELAGFEKIPSRNLVEIEINEFQKTSTGKIKRSNYIEAGRVRR